jgi:hypothetical protein
MNMKSEFVKSPLKWSNIFHSCFLCSEVVQTDFIIIFSVYRYRKCNAPNYNGSLVIAAKQKSKIICIHISFAVGVW